MKNIKVINESSAITMYYGYNKYRDIFVTNKDKVNSGIKKHVIFIDIGYSKTQIIYSIFKYNEFIVKDVESYPLIGGRNFNKLIFNELKNKFSEKYEIEEKITQKNIIR
jgi:molecular chaperone DnaK (HSP70)